MSVTKAKYLLSGRVMFGARILIPSHRDRHFAMAKIVKKED